MFLPAIAKISSTSSTSPIEVELDNSEAHTKQVFKHVGLVLNMGSCVSPTV